MKITTKGVYGDSGDEPVNEPATPMDRIAEWIVKNYPGKDPKVITDSGLILSEGNPNGTLEFTVDLSYFNTTDAQLIYSDYGISSVKTAYKEARERALARYRDELQTESHKIMINRATGEIKIDDGRGGYSANVNISMNQFSQPTAQDMQNVLKTYRDASKQASNWGKP